MGSPKKNKVIDSKYNLQLDHKMLLFPRLLDYPKGVIFDPSTSLSYSTYPTYITIEVPFGYYYDPANPKDQFQATEEQIKFHPKVHGQYFNNKLKGIVDDE